MQAFCVLAMLNFLAIYSSLVSKNVVHKNKDVGVNIKLEKQERIVPRIRFCKAFCLL